MNSNLHALIHGILIVAQMIAAADVTKYLSFIPPKWAGLAMVIIAGIQGAVGWYNHYYNPDGTHASTPWVEPPK